MTDASDLASDVRAARERLIVFVGRCPTQSWSSSPLADDDPRTVAVIIDHVADAYEYLASFVAALTRSEPVEVSPDVVDDLNARHAAASVPAPTKESAIEHLVGSGDALVALIEPLNAQQLMRGEGPVTVAGFATIAARHADSHRIELEQALDLTG
jgi:hypothetical protein